jgi:hypothetical protein
MAGLRAGHPAPRVGAAKKGERFTTKARRTFPARKARNTLVLREISSRSSCLRVEPLLRSRTLAGWVAGSKAGHGEMIGDSRHCRNIDLPIKRLRRRAAPEDPIGRNPGTP